MQKQHKDNWLNMKRWEDVANYHLHRRCNLHWGLKWEGKKQWPAARDESAWEIENSTETLGEGFFTCIHCNWDTHSHIGLYSHNRCSATTNTWGITFWLQIQGLSRLMVAKKKNSYNSQMKTFNVYKYVFVLKIEF